jgi:hypothetical protein
MNARTVSRWSRAFVVAGVVSFVAWHAAVFAGFGRPVTVILGLYGFVFSVVFGKGYSLVPSYFGRELAVPSAPAAHLPLAVGGTAGMALEAAGVVDPAVGAVAAVGWFVGCVLFVVALLWSVRDALSGRETGTSDANRHRYATDRVANLFVPVTLGYLLVGAALTALEAAAYPTGGVSLAGPPATHVLAAGAATLLVFAIGFRLFPRFLVANPRRELVGLVLLAGSIAPALLAGDFLGGTAFAVGAVLQATAVVGFGLAYCGMYLESDRRRIGLQTALVAASFGGAAVALGLLFALGGPDAAAVDVHYRLALGGFLGLTIVGVTFQFYPPSIGSTPGVSDRTAAVSVGLLGGGLALEATGTLLAETAVTTVGSTAALAGAAVYAFVILTLFVERL